MMCKTLNIPGGATPFLGSLVSENALLGSLVKRWSLTSISVSISRVCIDLQGTLERLEPLVLQSLTRQVFKKFTIGKVGRGRNQKSWIESYEFTEDIQDLLAQQHTLVADAEGTDPPGPPAVSFLGSTSLQLEIVIE